jgi:predicted amidohydrolase
VLNVVRTDTVDRNQEIVLARANATVNQVFVASVNAADPSGLGHSVLVGPEGTVLSEPPGAVARPHPPGAPRTDTADDTPSWPRPC